jgi:PAS domain S-box-containing protein
MHEDQIQPGEEAAVPFQAILEHLPVVVYVDAWDAPIPQTLYISPNVQEVLGYPPALFSEPGERWLDTVHPDDLVAMRIELARCSTAGVPYELHYRFIHPDGHDVWVRDRAIPYRDPETGEGRWMGALEDVTARVEAELANAASTVQYETLLENVPAVVYETDPDDDRRTRYMNRKIEDLLGYTMEEWLDQPDMWSEVLHPDDREVELAAHDVASTTGDPWQREYRLIGADGQVVWVRDQAVLLRDADGNPTRWQGVMVDITAEKEAQLALAAAHDDLEFRVRGRTAALQEANELMGIEIAERRRAEDERQRAEQQLGHILDNVPAVVYLWQMRESDDGAFFEFITPKIAEMLGYSPAEWTDGGWRERLHPHDRDRVNEAAQQSIDEGIPFQMEYRYLAKDGRVVWVVDHAVLLRRNDRGEPLVFEGVMMNVTALHEAEQKAADAEDRFRTLVERGPAVHYSYVLRSWDPPHVAIEYLSPQLGDLLGMSADAWIDNPMVWFDMIHPDDRDGMLAASRHTWLTGEPWASEYRILAGDGRIVWLADRGHCVERDEHGHPMRFLGTIADITARREHLHAIETELQTLRAVVGVAPAITWTETVDRATGISRYTYISPEAAEVVGLTPDQLIAESEHFPRLVHVEDRARVMAMNRGSEETGLWEDTYRIMRPDGEIRWVHGRGRRVDTVDPGVLEWHGITIDVTAQVEAALAAGLSPEAWATIPRP